MLLPQEPLQVQKLLTEQLLLQHRKPALIQRLDLQTQELPLFRRQLLRPFLPIEFRLWEFRLLQDRRDSGLNCLSGTRISRRLGGCGNGLGHDLGWAEEGRDAAVGFNLLRVGRRSFGCFSLERHGDRASEKKDEERHFEEFISGQLRVIRGCMLSNSSAEYHIALRS
jgi:hypothetical protein